MEKVVCISAAKVPIVKIWDPELELACDMNVNNTLALENTRMIRVYVEIDPRVRQLMMIIKYWTRKRIINDAGMLFFVQETKDDIFLTRSSIWWHSQLIHLDLSHHRFPPTTHTPRLARDPPIAIQDAQIWPAKRVRR